MIPAKLLRRLKVYQALIRAKPDTLRRLDRGDIRKVLVVCYGNIYRSPFVECFLSQKLPPDFTVKSAGFFPKAGRASPDQHVRMAAEYGVDLSRHSSVIVDRQMVDWAHVILIMDRHNWSDISKFGPAATQKVAWMGALLANQPVEIADPYNRNETEARRIVQQLLQASEVLLGTLTG